MKMKISSNLLIIISIAGMLVLKIAFTDAVPLTESNASDENDASVREKKTTDMLTTQHAIPTPLRRHHLKFGVLGKRHLFDYFNRRNEVPESNDDFEDLVNLIREQRAGRPQYGLLG